MKQFLPLAAILAAAGAVLYFGSPAVEPKVSVGAPPDHTISDSTAAPISNCKGGICEKCECPGDGRCERGECDAKEPMAVAQCVCGGDGLLDTPLGVVLCPTCGKGKSSDIPSYQPTFTQPQYTAPQPEYVTVQQPYTVSAGLFGRRSYTAYRTVRMLKSEYDAQKARPQTYYYGGGCANGRCR